MSDQIKHECGIAMVRLLKPLSYYQERYGSAFYGLNKMYLLMEKQHNRGQDGAGIASIKFDAEPGRPYIDRVRSNSAQPISDVFKQVNTPINEILRENPEKANDTEWLKRHVPFASELYLGHVRYGTYGGNSIEAVHPFLRENNWMHRNLIVAGNFNMTNVDELFKRLLDLGQHPKEKADTITVMERIGHFLDEEVINEYQNFKMQGVSKREASPLIAENLNLQNILKKSAKRFDGGYVIGGMIGHGDAFVLRDPAGIRPAYYYKDEEVVVVASERPVIQTAFNVPFESVHEIQPGNALIIKKSGRTQSASILEPLPKKACSFERIYFSRGSDAEIYQERKMLGKKLVEPILEAVGYDVENTVFSYIPNTAESSFFGLAEGMNEYLNSKKVAQIAEFTNNEKAPSHEELLQILNQRIRTEKIAIKDAKLRTFITEDASRDDLVAHVYDVTYGVIQPTDNLVLIDDSIVRGTTLKKSVIRIMDRLNPKHIVIVSSAPQIRYPDCYGIDMARLDDFVAFRAAIELLKENGQEHIIEQVYDKCKAQENIPDENVVNYVKEIYMPFTDEQISDKIAQFVTSDEIKAKVSIIYQSVEGLHESCTKNAGDWYFTGDYPTCGGNRVVNRAFINYVEGNKERAY